MSYFGSLLAAAFKGSARLSLRQLPHPDAGKLKQVLLHLPFHIYLYSLLLFFSYLTATDTPSH